MDAILRRAVTVIEEFRKEISSYLHADDDLPPDSKRALTKLMERSYRVRDDLNTLLNLK